MIYKHFITEILKLVTVKEERDKNAPKNVTIIVILYYKSWYEIVNGKYFNTKSVSLSSWQYFIQYLLDVLPAYNGSINLSSKFWQVQYNGIPKIC